MSANKENDNSKDNFIKMKAQLYFSPYSNKKMNLGNVFTEPRNIHQEIDSNLSKNQIKQKLSNVNITKNIINMQQQDNFKNNIRLISELAEKANQNRKNDQSNKKLYLKKNVSNIPVLNDIGPNFLSTQPNSNSNTNINNAPNNPNIKFLKSRLTNIKFNIGKSSQNVLNSKGSTNHLKKNAGSACELLDNNNYLRKSKTKGKNLVELNKINPIDYIYSSEKSFLSPKNKNHGSNPKIIFLKNDKNQNTNKELKINQTQGNEPKNNEGNNNKNQINCLLGNTFTNVKIYPTTILNNKIIYNQIDKNNQNNQNKNNTQNSKNNKSEMSNNNSSSMHHNNSKVKKEKIVIETVDKKPNNNKNENFQSIEELHYFYVDTLQRGKNYAIKLDKCNN